MNRAVDYNPDDGGMLNSPDPLAPNFLEFVEEGQMLRHKKWPQLIGKCVGKGRSFYMDGQTHHTANFLNATLEFPSGRRITFTHLFLEEIPKDG